MLNNLDETKKTNQSVVNQKKTNINKLFNNLNEIKKGINPQGNQRSKNKIVYKHLKQAKMQVTYVKVRKILLLI